MSTSSQISREFHHNLVSFIDELIEQFPREVDFIIGRLIIKDRPSDTIINMYIREIFPHKESVTNREESFFLENKISILNGLDSGKVNHFKVLWKSSDLDEEDRDIIWKWFDTFNLLTERYQEVKMRETQKAM